MQRLGILLWILSIPSYADTSPSDSAPLVVLEPIVKPEDIEAEPNTKDQEPGWMDENVAPQTKKVERFVMPLTNWVEKKLHDSSITNPVPQKPRKAPVKNGELSLREAIDKARQKSPGTVLSADKIKLNGHTTYKIKILSKDGVIRMVSVQGKQQTADKQEQP